MPDFQFPCPHCGAIIAPNLVPAQVKPASFVPAQFAPEVVTPAAVTGLTLVKPPPAPIQPPPPVKRKVPFGPWNMPLDLLGPLYSGTVLYTEPAKLVAQLTLVRAKGGSVVLTIPRSKMKDGAGHLSVAAFAAWLPTVPDLVSFIADGTVLGFSIGDDITATEWGPMKMPERFAAFDAIGQALRARWSTIGVAIRARPDEIKTHPWKVLPIAWSVYRGPQRDGTPEAFRDAQVAAAKALKTELVLWFNSLDGGDGSSKILGTYKDPDEEGKSPNRWQMAAAEVLKYGKVFLPVTKWALHWQYSPIYEKASLPSAQLKGVQNFDNRPDVKAAMAELRKLAG